MSVIFCPVVLILSRFVFISSILVYSFWNYVPTVLIPAKNLPDSETLPFITSSKVKAKAQLVVSMLDSMSEALDRPTIAAIEDKSRAKIRTTVGQMSSHFVYCSSSFFWQHLEGQQEGQTQQQHKNIQIKMMIIKPSAKGTTKMINSVAVYVIN